MMRPCITCGIPSVSTRCTAHAQELARTSRRGRPDLRGTAKERGYDSRWDRLSKRARALQPWCSDCLTTKDLTGDHERWPATDLSHLDVVCRACNSRRGAIRGKAGGDAHDGGSTDPQRGGTVSISPRVRA